MWDDLPRLHPEVRPLGIGTDGIARAEITAGTERAPGTGEDEHARVTIVAVVAAESRKLRVHGAVDGIQPLRPVERVCDRTGQSGNWGGS